MSFKQQSTPTSKNTTTGVFTRMKVQTPVSTTKDGAKTSNADMNAQLFGSSSSSVSTPKPSSSGLPQPLLQTPKATPSAGKDKNSDTNKQPVGVSFTTLLQSVQNMGNSPMPAENLASPMTSRGKSSPVAPSPQQPPLLALLSSSSNSRSTSTTTTTTTAASSTKLSGDGSADSTSVTAGAVHVSEIFAKNKDEQKSDVSMADASETEEKPAEPKPVASAKTNDKKNAVPKKTNYVLSDDEPSSESNDSKKGDDSEADEKSDHAPSSVEEENNADEESSSDKKQDDDEVSMPDDMPKKITYEDIAITEEEQKKIEKLLRGGKNLAFPCEHNPEYNEGKTLDKRRACCKYNAAMNEINKRRKQEADDKNEEAREKYDDEKRKKKQQEKEKELHKKLKDEEEAEAAEEYRISQTPRRVDEDFEGDDAMEEAEEQEAKQIDDDDDDADNQQDKQEEKKKTEKEKESASPRGKKRAREETPISPKPKEIPQAKTNLPPNTNNPVYKSEEYLDSIITELNNEIPEDDDCVVTGIKALIELPENDDDEHDVHMQIDATNNPPVQPVAAAVVPVIIPVLATTSVPATKPATTKTPPRESVEVPTPVPELANPKTTPPSTTTSLPLAAKPADSNVNVQSAVDAIVEVNKQMPVYDFTDDNDTDMLDDDLLTRPAKKQRVEDVGKFTMLNIPCLYVRPFSPSLSPLGVELNAGASDLTHTMSSSMKSVASEPLKMLIPDHKNTPVEHRNLYNALTKLYFAKADMGSLYDEYLKSTVKVEDNFWRSYTIEEVMNALTLDYSSLGTGKRKERFTKLQLNTVIANPKNDEEIKRRDILVATCQHNYLQNRALRALAKRDMPRFVIVFDAIKRFSLLEAPVGDMFFNLGMLLLRTDECGHYIAETYKEEMKADVRKELKKKHKKAVQAKDETIQKLKKKLRKAKSEIESLEKKKKSEKEKKSKKDKKSKKNEADKKKKKAATKKVEKKVEKKDDKKVEKKDEKKVEKKDEKKVEKKDDKKVEKKDEKKVEKKDEKKGDKKEEAKDTKKKAVDDDDDFQTPPPKPQIKPSVASTPLKIASASASTLDEKKKMLTQRQQQDSATKQVTLKLAKAVNSS